MNRYDEKYDIRLAKYDEIPKIMEFIDVYWRSGHVMTYDRELFEYEFVDDGKVNIVIAIDRETDSIQGMSGFLYSSHTDGKRDIWGSIWKANAGHGNIPLLGMELSKRMEELASIRYRIGTGNNPKTAVPINKLVFNREVIKLKHYYYPNPRRDDYKIAIIKEKKKNVSIPQESIKVELDEINSMFEFRAFINIENLDTVPYKDNWYIEHRYFNHPRYKYKLLGVSCSDQEKAVLIGRQIEQNGSKIFRIVDCLGNHKLIAYLDGYLKEWVKDYEYIDFFEYGISDEIMKQAGFIDREETGDIVPNYFEPFVQENVDIWGFVPTANTIICKADGDQDRPNM